MRDTAGTGSNLGALMRTFAFGFAAVAVLFSAGCASSGETVISARDAARAECEARQPPPADMQACILEAEQTIRDARDLARRQPPRPQPRPPG